MSHTRCWELLRISSVIAATHLELIIILKCAELRQLLLLRDRSSRRLRFLLLLFWLVVRHFDVDDVEIKNAY